MSAGAWSTRSCSSRRRLTSQIPADVEGIPTGAEARQLLDRSSSGDHGRGFKRQMTAPHLWGKTPEEAEDRRTLTKIVESLPHDTIRDLIRLMKRMTPGEPSADTVVTSNSESR